MFYKSQYNKFYINRDNRVFVDSINADLVILPISLLTSNVSYLFGYFVYEVNGILQI